jgi:flagellar motor switch protein FliN/FliY
VATLDKVSVDLMVVLGTTTMPIHQVMRLSRGAIIELDATEADEVKILASPSSRYPKRSWRNW